MGVRFPQDKVWVLLFYDVSLWSFIDLSVRNEPKEWSQMVVVKYGKHKLVVIKRDINTPPPPEVKLPRVLIYLNKTKREQLDRKL